MLPSERVIKDLQAPTSPVRRTSFKEGCQSVARRLSYNLEKAKRRLSTPPDHEYDDEHQKKSKRDSWFAPASPAQWYQPPPPPPPPARPLSITSNLPVGFGPPRQETLYDSNRQNRYSVYVDEEERELFGQYQSPHLLSTEPPEIPSSEPHIHHPSSKQSANPPTLTVDTGLHQDGSDFESDDDSLSLSSAGPSQTHRCPWPGCNSAKTFQMNRLKEHIRRAHIQPFVCAYPGCEYRRGDHNQIKRHYKTKHNTIPSNSVIVSDTDDALANYKHQALKTRSLDIVQVTEICEATEIPAQETTSPAVVVYHPTAPPAQNSYTPTSPRPRSPNPRRFSYDKIMAAVGETLQTTHLSEAEKVAFCRTLKNNLVSPTRPQGRPLLEVNTRYPPALSSTSSVTEPISSASSAMSIPAPSGWGLGPADGSMGMKTETMGFSEAELGAVNMAGLADGVLDMPMDWSAFSDIERDFPLNPEFGYSGGMI